MRVVRSRGRARRRARCGRAARRRRPSATGRCSASAISSGRGTSRCRSSPTRSGHVVVLGERDCSVQRRHQKIVEESPAPDLSSGTRRALEEAAAMFVSGDRLPQRRDGRVPRRRRRLLLPRAERPHPGRASRNRGDVRHRHRRASARRRRGRGGSTAYEPEQRGHAIEARLYAEDPRTFLPQAGRDRPAAAPTGIRVDTGVAEGDRIGTSYDPMIAKLIAHGPNAGVGARSARRRARRDRGRGHDHESPVPALADRPSRRSATGSATTAFLVDHPPLSPPHAVCPPVPGASRGASTSRRPRPRHLRTSTSARAASAEHGDAAVTAPMPGTVLRVEVAAGDAVEARQPLVVLEAMKMETPVTSPFAATVKAVHVARGRPRRRRGAARRARRPP